MNEVVMITTTTGAVAAVISFVLFLPQARTTWINRNNQLALKGISLGMHWLILCNASLWLIYAILSSAFWVGAASFANLPLVALTIILVKRSTKYS